jgi:hypothetical protein
MINAAAANGYNVLIIDSLSHAWSGPGGVLEIVDNEAARSKSSNSYVAWRKGTPEHNALIDAMLNAPVHIIATMRSKTEYVIERDEKTGKSAPRKIGLAPVQRDGMEYEFDVVGEMDMGNTLLVSKSRCPKLNNAVISKPGQEIADALRAWLSDGVTPEPVPTPAPASLSTPEQPPVGHDPVTSEPPAPAGDPADDIDAALGRTAPEDTHDPERETPETAQDAVNFWDDATNRSVFYKALGVNIKNWKTSKEAIAHALGLSEYDDHQIVALVRDAKCAHAGAAMQWIHDKLNAQPAHV